MVAFVNYQVPGTVVYADVRHDCIMQIPDTWYNSVHVCCSHWTDTSTHLYLAQPASVLICLVERLGHKLPIGDGDTHTIAHMQQRDLAMQ